MEVQGQNTTVTSINAAVAIQKNASAVLEMIDIFDEFATDAALETGGAWVTYRGATRFKIARANNDLYGAALTKAIQENQEELKKGTPESEALSERLMLEVMAETILVGFEHVKYKRQPVEYSKAVAVEMLAHNDFRLWVKRQSENREYFKAVLVEEAAKN
jgi:hypothetical protein